MKKWEVAYGYQCFMAGIFGILMTLGIVASFLTLNLFIITGTIISFMLMAITVASLDDITLKIHRQYFPKNYAKLID